MKTLKKPIKAVSKIPVSGTRAAMSIFNDTQILSAQKREVLTDYLFEFLPSDIPTTQDFPLLDGSTALRLTALKKSRRNQLIIIGAYLVHFRDNGPAKDGTKKPEKKKHALERIKTAGIFLSIANGLKKLLELISGSPSH